MPIIASSSVSRGKIELYLVSRGGVRKVWKGAGSSSVSCMCERAANDSGGSSLMVLAKLISTSRPFPLELGELTSESGMLPSLPGNALEARVLPLCVLVSLSWSCSPDYP